ncbi:CHC2 zinc finger domain-containing protein [Kribbella sp. NBC_01505]|uniref:CHC2 zinc finger domain-containing protein n=1 Tax=Kribbella sp. NBC_01505 TaxID=2903580 RepID=UPI00386FBFC9
MSDGRPDLADLLEHYDVPVNRGRSSQMVKCPLHEDRTASCSINTERGLWNCHSCGSGGDSYALIMKKEGLTFAGARDFAASVGLANGAAGGGDRKLSGSRYASRRPIPARKGNRAGGSSYQPSWRR